MRRERQASLAIVGAARRLRREMTPSEAVLWKVLRRRRLNGLIFRRQHPVRGFVVDFYCVECSLAIELDGSVHELPEQRQRDIERQRDLEAIGITVLRFTNAQVLSSLPTVLATIAATARSLQSDRPTAEPQ